MNKLNKMAVSGKIDTIKSILPDWVEGECNVNVLNCTVEKCTNGGFIVLDHSLQVGVISAQTNYEAQMWINDRLPTVNYYL